MTEACISGSVHVMRSEPISYAIQRVDDTSRMRKENEGSGGRFNMSIRKPNKGFEACKTKTLWSRKATFEVW